MYINIETKKVVTRSELEDLHRDPYVAFPEDVADEVLFEFGYANLRYQPQPNVGPDKVLKRGNITKTTEFGYAYTWLVVDRAVVSQEVDIERDRRIDSGFIYNDRPYQSGVTDRENITGSVQLAMLAIMGGVNIGDYRWMDDDHDFQWITADNEIVNLDAYDVVELGKLAAITKKNYIFKARMLKDMEVIPSDYTDDKWWE